MLRVLIKYIYNMLENISSMRAEFVFSPLCSQQSLIETLFHDYLTNV